MFDLMGAKVARAKIVGTEAINVWQVECVWVVVLMVDSCRSIGAVGNYLFDAIVQ